MSFRTDSSLVRHERMHMGTKPFRCTWTECVYASYHRSSVTHHIRVKHFGLPSTVKEQKRQGIEDQRNPNDYIEVDSELLGRRLQ